jgi:hypothetical protein
LARRQLWRASLPKCRGNEKRKRNGAADEESYAAERCRYGSVMVVHEQISPAQLAERGYRCVARNITTPCGGTSAWYVTRAAGRS